MAMPSRRVPDCEQRGKARQGTRATAAFRGPRRRAATVPGKTVALVPGGHRAGTAARPRPYVTSGADSSSLAVLVIWFQPLILAIPSLVPSAFCFWYLITTVPYWNLIVSDGPR